MMRLLNNLEIAIMHTNLKPYIYLILSCIKFCHADCIFYVINNSNVEVYAEAGFYTKQTDAKTFKIDHATSNSITIKSNENCTSTDVAGLGLAYIKLVNTGKGSKNYSTGSWIYNKNFGAFYAVGQSLVSSEGALGTAPDGTQLILLNNFKPNDQRFEVVIKQASRNASKPGSMN